MEKTIVRKIYSAVLSALVTFLAGLALRKVWSLTTGAEPPDPEDPDVPAPRAIGWFLASGVGVGLAQLLVARFMARRAAQAPEAADA